MDKLKQLDTNIQNRIKNKLHSRLERNIILDYVNTFVTNLNMQSSIWVLYLAYCGLNLTEVGLLEGIYHATSIICEIPSGAMADLLGRKKSMIISRICVAVSCIIMLFSKSFWLFALSFMIQALGNNFNSGSEEALVYDSMKCLDKEDKYMGVYGRLNVILEVSQAIATVAGGVLAEYSYFWCYAACCIVALIALVPVAFMTEPPVRESSSEEPDLKSEPKSEPKYLIDEKADSVFGMVKKHFITSFMILKGNIKILKVIVYYSVIFASYTLLFFYSQQFYSDMGYNKIGISIILLFTGAVSCLGALVSEKLYALLGKKLTVIATVLIAAAYIGYGFEHSGIAIAGFLVASFMNSVLYPVQSDELNSLIPSKQRATLISVSSMFFSIAMIITFPVAGAMADSFGIGRIFGILGIVLLAFLSVWKMAEKKKKAE